MLALLANDLDWIQLHNWVSWMIWTWTLIRIQEQDDVQSMPYTPAAIPAAEAEDTPMRPPPAAVGLIPGLPEQEAVVGPQSMALTSLNLVGSLLHHHHLCNTMYHHWTFGTIHFDFCGSASQ